MVRRALRGSKATRMLFAKKNYKRYGISFPLKKKKKKRKKERKRWNKFVESGKSTLLGSLGRAEMRRKAWGEPMEVD